MRSVISKYALEGRGDNGAPTGKFYLDLPQFFAVSEEVVRTHLGFTGAKNKAYLDEHCPQIFKHLDVNNQGWLVAEKAPVALRMLLDEVEIQNGLQLQLSSSIESKNTWRPNPVLSPWAEKPSPAPPSTKITDGF